MTDTTQITTVACNHCGAPLQISPTTNFATCGYCGAQLEIKRSGSAVYTEVLQRIDSRTQRIEQDVEHIKRQNQVEQLDREWMLRREQYMSRNKDGSRSIPSAAGSVFGAVVAVIFGIIWIGVASTSGAPGFFVLFGLVVVIGAVVSSIVGIGKSARYTEAERAYQLQRDALMRSHEQERA
jgi:hypothetical protein